MTCFATPPFDMLSDDLVWRIATGSGASRTEFLLLSRRLRAVLHDRATCVHVPNADDFVDEAALLLPPFKNVRRALFYNLPPQQPGGEELHELLRLVRAAAPGITQLVATLHHQGLSSVSKIPKEFSFEGVVRANAHSPLPELQALGGWLQTGRLSGGVQLRVGGVGAGVFASEPLREVARWATEVWFDVEAQWGLVCNTSLACFPNCTHLLLDALPPDRKVARRVFNAFPKLHSVRVSSTVIYSDDAEILPMLLRRLPGGVLEVTQDDSDDDFLEGVLDFFEASADAGGLPCALDLSSWSEHDLHRLSSYRQPLRRPPPFPFASLSVKLADVRNIWTALGAVSALLRGSEVSPTLGNIALKLTVDNYERPTQAQDSILAAFACDVVASIKAFTLVHGWQWQGTQEICKQFGVAFAQAAATD